MKTKLLYIWQKSVALLIFIIKIIVKIYRKQTNSLQQKTKKFFLL